MSYAVKQVFARKIGDSMGEIADKMKNLLEEAFAPAHLEIIDQSDRHIGHAGYDGRGESHFRIVIRADAFNGESRVTCHRMIYEQLDPLLKDRVHALAIKIIKN